MNDLNKGADISMLKKYVTKQLMLLFCIISLLTSCNTFSPKETINLQDDQSTLTPVVISESEKSSDTLNTKTKKDELMNSGDNYHNSLFPALETVLTTDTKGINYSNYTNMMPIIETEDMVYIFDYNGYIKIYNQTNRSEKTVHICEILLSSSISERSDKDSDWFFMGALVNRSAIYARYDLIGVESYSLLIRIDFSGDYAEICVANPYYENESLNSFSITNDFIYYTYCSYDDSGHLISSILLCDLDGSNPRILQSFSEGLEISSLLAHDNLLYFSVENQESYVSIYSYSLTDLTLNIEISDCSRFDFLYLYDNYFIVGATDSQLVAYKIGTKKTIYVKVCENLGLQFGSILINDDNCYVQVFSWEEQSPTKILPVYFPDKSVGDYILFSYDYHHVVGISNDVAYIEFNSNYKKYDLKTKKELSF